MRVRIQVACPLIAVLAACSGEIDGQSPASATGAPVAPVASSFGSGVPGAGAEAVDALPPGQVVPPELPTCGGEALSPARIVRLTVEEFENTLADLLELPEAPELNLGADPQVDGFHNNAAALSVSTAFAGQLRRLASQFSSHGVAKFAQYSGCDSQALNDEVCIETFIANFGRRAFRRPLRAQEIERYMEVYRVGLASEAAELGLQQVVKTMLQSPNLLYRTELGVAGASAEELVQLDTFELASALSYTLWGTMPDEPLLSLAESGKLANPEVTAAQVRRLLESPRAKTQVRDFAQQWLGIRPPNDLVRAQDVFPEFQQTKADLHEEFLRLVDDAFLAPDATLARLYVSDRSYFSPAVADYYQLPGAASEPGFRQVSLLEPQLSEQGRVGLLTSATLIASWSGEENTAPMTRGKMIYNRLLCQALPDPPAELEIPELPDTDNISTREKFVLHGEDPTCAGCHARLDSVAFALEHFNHVGQRGEEENGLPIDASGSLLGTDMDGPFEDMADLARKLSTSTHARACLAREYVRFASASGKAADSECLQQSMVETAAVNDDSFADLVTALLTSDFFITRGPQKP